MYARDVEDAEPFEFEGRLVPTGDALVAALLGDDRAWLVRASVVSERLARRVERACAALLESPDPAERSAALHVGISCYARGLAPAAVAAWDRGPAQFVAVPDPGRPGGTLAQALLELLVLVSGPHAPDSRRVILEGLAFPELRVPAWYAAGRDAPEAVVPHLAALLAEAPDLVESVATQFAVVHTEHCPAAAAEVARLPRPLRERFERAIKHQLERIRAIRIWATCRNLLRASDVE
jgi:hypothetical protein